jgi:hypothetical protein
MRVAGGRYAELPNGAVARVRAHPFLPHRESVRGVVYDVSTGNVREVI